MKEFLKEEWLNLLWIAISGWIAYGLWGYWPAALVSLGFFELWVIRLQLDTIVAMLKIADYQRKQIAKTGEPLNLE